MFLIGLPLVTAATSLLGGFMGSRESGAERSARRKMGEAERTQKVRTWEADQRAGGSEGVYSGSRDEYVSGLRSFDPRDYAGDVAGSMQSGFLDAFQKAEGLRNVGLNRRGFLGSNVGAGRMGEQFANQLAQSLAGLSMSAAGLERSRLSGFGDVAGMDLNKYQYDRGIAEGNRNTYLDLLAGNRDAAIGQGNSKREAWGNAAGGFAQLLPRVWGK